MQAFSHPLYDLAKIYLPGTRSDLLQCLEQPEKSEPPLTYDCEVLDELLLFTACLLPALTMQPNEQEGAVCF